MVKSLLSSFDRTGWIVIKSSLFPFNQQFISEIFLKIKLGLFIVRYFSFCHFSGHFYFWGDFLRAIKVIGLEHLEIISLKFISVKSIPLTPSLQPDGVILLYLKLG